MSISRVEDSIDYKKSMLIHFINYYLSKSNLKMKDFMGFMYSRIYADKKVSINQFLILLRFLEREEPFKGASKVKVVKYFSPFIIGYRLFIHKEIKQNDHNTLCEFIY